MKSHDALDAELRRASVPDRPADYWKFFPARVMTRLQREEVREAPRSEIHIAWGFGAAMVVAGLLAFFLAVPQRQGDLRSSDRRGLPRLGIGVEEPQTVAEHRARAKKVYEEIAPMFPGQLNAIITDKDGVQVVLAEGAATHSSPPLFLEVCARSGCREIITFSGQQVKVGDKSCEVLLDGRGHVLLVGPRLFWSSDDAQAPAGELRIKAERLSS